MIILIYLPFLLKFLAQKTSEACTCLLYLLTTFPFTCDASLRVEQIYSIVCWLKLALHIMFFPLSPVVPRLCTSCIFCYVKRLENRSEKNHIFLHVLRRRKTRGFGRERGRKEMKETGLGRKDDEKRWIPTAEGHQKGVLPSSVKREKGLALSCMSLNT